VPINENLRIDLLHIKEVLNLDSLHQVIPEGA
jgi:hypothetical protein